MIILDGSAQVFQAVLGGAVSTDQPEFQVSYGKLNADSLDSYLTNQGELNSTTDVALVAGVASRQIGIKAVSVYNRDTAQVVVTFKKDISAVDRLVYRATLEVNESVHYESERGWYVVDANGVEKSNAGSPTHTGDVTGTEALIIDPTGISGKTLVTAVIGDMVLIWDATDSTLKRANISDFLPAEVNDLTAAVVWANVPDANITVGSVTQHTAAILADLDFGIQFFIAAGANATYTIDQSASFAYTIIDAVAETVTGTITMAVEIDGTPVTGISAMAIVTGETTDTASAANTVAANAQVTLVFTSDASAVGLSVKLNCTRD